MLTQDKAINDDKGDGFNNDNSRMGDGDTRKEIISTYPLLLLGILGIPKGHALSTDDKRLHYAMVRTATKILSRETLEEEFITQFTVSDKRPHPLIVFDDLGATKAIFLFLCQGGTMIDIFGDRIEI